MSESYCDNEMSECKGKAVTRPSPEPPSTNVSDSHDQYHILWYISFQFVFPTLLLSVYPNPVNGTIIF